MKLIRKLFPILTWLPNYPKHYLRGDLSAGLTVGVMLIPQGMAYAMIAGLPPVYGLYASIVPQLIYALMGTSRQLSVAPVAMDSLLVASGVAVMASQGTNAYITFAVLLAFFMGLFQLLLGSFKMGFITNLLSRPVISGFTSAAAFIIALSQLKHLLGLDIGNSSRLLDLFQMLISNFSEIHLLTSLTGLLGIGIIVLSKRVHRSLPGALVAVILGISLVFFLGLNAAGVSIVAGIPTGLPDFRMVEFSLEEVKQLAPLAMTIAVIAYMEAFSVAKAIEHRKHTSFVRPNQELIALGAANVIGSLFQSYPVTGGFSRTAVNDESGANTPLAAIFSATIVILSLLFLMPLFYFLPKAILAAIVMVAIFKLVDIQLPIKLWKEGKVEFFLLMATFLSTLNFGMVEGIIVGISLSILHLLYKSAYPHIAKLGRLKGHHEFRNIKRFSDLEKWDNVLILRMDAPLTFINIQYFKDYVLSNLTEHTEIVLLDASPINHVDSTAIAGLNDLLSTLETKDIHFYICDIIGPVRDVFHKTGFTEILTRDNVFIDLNEAMKFIETHNIGDFKIHASQHT